MSGSFNTLRDVTPEEGQVTRRFASGTPELQPDVLDLMEVLEVPASATVV